MFKYRLVKAEEALFLLQKKFLFFKWKTINFWSDYRSAYMYFSRVANIDFKPEQILIESE